MAFPEQHRAWFLDVCKLLGLEGTNAEDAVRESGFLLNNEQPFLFTQGLMGDDSHLLIQGMIGTLPEKDADKVAVLRKALAYQWMIAGPQAPSIGIDPDTDTLVMSQCITPAEVSPEVMMGMLRMIATTLVFVRDHVFNDDKEGMPAADSGLDPSLLAAQEQQQRILAQLGG